MEGKSIPIDKISVDENGRIIIDDPELARKIKEAIAEAKSSDKKPLLNILCGCNMPCL